jgi:hypothetical protein
VILLRFDVPNILLQRDEQAMRKQILTSSSFVKIQKVTHFITLKNLITQFWERIYVKCHYLLLIFHFLEAYHVKGIT